MSRARRDDGFTLVELLVTMLLGTIVLGGLLGLVTSSEQASKRVTDRIDASQRGRTAMEQIGQELRAMVCLPSPPSGGSAPAPVVEGDATHVKWYANLDNAATNENGVGDANGDGDPTYDPQQRQLRIVGTPPGTVRVLEDRWTGPLPVAAGVAPSSTRLVLDGIAPATDGAATVPYLAYFGLRSDGTYETLAPADIAADPARVVRIDVAFRALPSSRTQATTVGRRPGADLRTSVYARQVNRSATPPIYGCVL
jgi:prepilin-type N-terminal cleavage/methylation domain-containing protein